MLNNHPDEVKLVLCLMLAQISMSSRLEACIHRLKFWTTTPLTDSHPTELPAMSNLANYPSPAKMKPNHPASAQAFDALRLSKIHS